MFDEYDFYFSCVNGMNAYDESDMVKFKVWNICKMLYMRSLTNLTTLDSIPVFYWLLIHNASADRRLLA